MNLSVIREAKILQVKQMKFAVSHMQNSVVSTEIERFLSSSSVNEVIGNENRKLLSMTKMYSTSKQRYQRKNSVRNNAGITEG